MNLVSKDSILNEAGATKNKPAKFYAPPIPNAQWGMFYFPTKLGTFGGLHVGIHTPYTNIRIWEVELDRTNENESSQIQDLLFQKSRLKRWTMLKIVQLHGCSQFPTTTEIVGFQRSTWLSFGLGCDMWPIKRGNLWKFDIPFHNVAPCGGLTLLGEHVVQHQPTYEPKTEGAKRCKRGWIRPHA